MVGMFFPGVGFSVKSNAVCTCATSSETILSVTTSITITIFSVHSWLCCCSRTSNLLTKQIFLQVGDHGHKYLCNAIFKMHQLSCDYL